MKTSQQSHNWREIARSWLKSPIVLICVPIFVVGVLLVWPVYSELQASREIQNELRLVVEEGFPTTEAEIEKEFIANTFTDGTLALNRIEILSTVPGNAGRSLTLPYVAGDVSPLAILIPGKPWPEEPRVAEFLSHIQPLLDEVDQLEKVARPVWMPRIPMKGPYNWAYSAVLQQMIRILRLAFDHAVYHQNSQLAMQHLRSLTLMFESTDWRLSAFEDALINFKPVYYSIVNRSMVSAIWSKSQLQELHQHVAEPLDLAERWRRITALEIVGYSQWVHSRQEIGSQNEALQILRSLRNWKTLFDGSFQSIGNRIHRVTVPSDFEPNLEEISEYVDESFLAVFGLSNFEALFSLELSRRQTLVVIAIKEYQIANGHWPNQLSDLEAFGLTADDWSPPGRQEWKYEFDDSEARLSSVVKPQYKIRSPGTAAKLQEIIRIR